MVAEVKPPVKTEDKDEPVEPVVVVVPLEEAVAKAWESVRDDS